MRTFFVTLAVLSIASLLEASPSVWAYAPKPKFPSTALSKGSEGYVNVRAVIGPDGAVSRVSVAKSSGDATLDEAARIAVLKWKMNAAAIKPEYRSKGFDVRIDFRQETPVMARYRDRTAYFPSYQSAKHWTYAPFPEYPFHERLVRTEGTTKVRGVIGADGGVTSVEVAQSSGNANLDKAAVAAVCRWRAHKEYAGQHFVLPIKFTMR